MTFFLQLAFYFEFFYFQLYDRYSLSCEYQWFCSSRLIFVASLQKLCVSPLADVFLLSGSLIISQSLVILSRNISSFLHARFWACYRSAAISVSNRTVPLPSHGLDTIPFWSVHFHNRPYPSLDLVSSRVQSVEPFFYKVATKSGRVHSKQQMRNVFVSCA